MNHDKTNFKEEGTTRYVEGAAHNLHDVEEIH